MKKLAISAIALLLGAALLFLANPNPSVGEQRSISTDPSFIFFQAAITNASTWAYTNAYRAFDVTSAQVVAATEDTFVIEIDRDGISLDQLLVKGTNTTSVRFETFGDTVVMLPDDVLEIQATTLTNFAVWVTGRVR